MVSLGGDSALHPVVSEDSTWSYFMYHNYGNKNEVGRYWRSLLRAGLESVMINDGAAALFSFFMRDELRGGGREIILTIVLQ